MRFSMICLTLLTALVAAAPCAAGYPFFSKFTTQANGPYAPRVNRYVVIDPAPVAAAPGYGSHHHAGAAPQGPLWTRRDDPAPVYPYGWFGARAATKNWSHVGYYDNYEDQRILHGK